MDFSEDNSGPVSADNQIPLPEQVSQNTPAQRPPSPQSAQQSAPQSDSFRPVLKTRPIPTVDPTTGGPQIVNPDDGQPKPLYHDKNDEPADRRDFHPAVQQSAVLRRVAEVLAGGPRYRTMVDPHTGETTREKVPLSRGDLILGAIANVLGGVGGALQNMDRVKHHQPTQPVVLPMTAATQQQNQQQETQSVEDFNRIQNEKVRKATVINANLEAMRHSFALRHEKEDILQRAVDNQADDLTNYKNAGVVKAERIPSSQAMKKGYNPATDLAVPDGHVPVIGSDGQPVLDKDGVPVSELTYSIIDGATAQAPLTQEKYDLLAKYGLMRAKQGFTIPDGATISAATSALMNYKLGLIQQSEDEINEVREANKAPKIDLSEQLRKNPSIMSALEKWHNEAMSDQPVQQMANVKAKHPTEAGLILNLFGGQSALDAYAAKTQTAGDLTPDRAQSIVSDPRTDKSSPAYEKAVAFLKNARTQKAQSAADDARAKQQAETNSGDVQQAARNIVGGDLTQLKDVTSMRGGQRTAMFNAIHDEAVRQGKNPSDYSPAALKTKSDMYEDYRQGKTSNNIAAFDAFLGHANDAMDANDAWRRTGSPLINRPVSWLAKNATNDQTYIAFDTALEPVRKEFMSFLNANRAEHETDLKTMQTILNTDSSPAQIETALKQLGKSADIRLAAIGRKYQNTMGSPFPNLVSDDGKQTLARMGIKSKAFGQASSNPQSVQTPANQSNQGGNFFSNFGGTQRGSQ
ncbi:MAG TPA: hypothetical protein VFO39_02240 [Candidatus Sulfotelmatobacter sp.]|nr:hypothetical protein [Candidatus Sulfotelmatobacter sp.]